MIYFSNAKNNEINLCFNNIIESLTIQLYYPISLAARISSCKLYGDRYYYKLFKNVI